MKEKIEQLEKKVSDLDAELESLKKLMELWEQELIKAGLIEPEI